MSNHELRLDMDARELRVRIDSNDLALAGVARMREDAARYDASEQWVADYLAGADRAEAELRATRARLDLIASVQSAR